MAYVYRHISLDKNEPFYIGISADLNYKRAYSKNGRNDIWNGIISRTDYEVDILFDGISISESKSKEIEFISLYGRICDGGTLSNLSCGGEGTFGIKGEQHHLFGKKLSSEAKSKMSKSRTGEKNFQFGKIGNLSPHFGKKRTIETRNKISESQKGKIGRAHTDESKKKISKKLTGLNRSKETRYKISQSKIGTKISEAHKAAVSKRATGNKYCLNRVLSEETKRKIGNANKGRKRTDTWKFANKGEKNGMFGKKHSAESRKKNSESQKKRPVIQYDLNNREIMRFNSIREAATHYKIFDTGIQSACIGRFKNYKKSIWGYDTI